MTTLVRSIVYGFCFICFSSQLYAVGGSGYGGAMSMQTGGVLAAQSIYEQVFSGIDAPKKEAFWMRPYGSYDKLHLRNAPEAISRSYGAVIGGDLSIFELGKGYIGRMSVFGAYNGGHHNFSDASVNQTGTVIGLISTFYKNDFFIAFGINMGVSSGEEESASGRDRFEMFTAGAALKTGYDFNIADGKITLQPNVSVGYVFVDMSDYKTAQDIEVKSDPLNALRIMPGLKISGNLTRTLQVYLKANAIWNIYGKTKFTVDDAAMPELSVKPYIQYGAGVEKVWSGLFSTYAQALFNSIGRQGISAAAGFKLSFGD